MRSKKIRALVIFLPACFIGIQMQAAMITPGQSLQLNFVVDGYNPIDKDYFNFFLEESDGLKTNTTTGTTATMIDSEGNTVDASLTASGWAGTGGDVNDSWAGMGSSTPAPGTSTWSTHEINNFWWDTSNPADTTMTIGGMDTDLTYNIYYYSKINQPASAEAHSVTINGTTKNTAGRGARWADTDHDLLFDNIATDGSGNLNISWGNVVGNSPFVNAIVIEAMADPNAPPAAIPQSLSLLKNDSANITLSATSASGTNLTFEVVSNPTNGVLSGTPPYLNYAPNTDYTGDDSFTFRVSNGITNSIAAKVALSIYDGVPLAAWWDFEETSGSPILDEISSTPATMEFQTGTTGLNVPGKFGAAYTGGVYFDGLTDNVLVETTDAAVTQPTGDFSIVLWIKPEGIQESWSRFVDTVSNPGGPPNDGYRLNRTNVEGQIQFAAKTGGSNIDLRSKDACQLDVWNLLVVRYDPSGNVSLNVLTEGDAVDAAFVAANRASKATGGGITYSSGATRIGAALSESSFYEFKGHMDDLAFYDGLLTDAQVADIFYKGLSSDVFLYPASTVSSGGQFDTNHPPSNLMNNGFTSFTKIIDTTRDYPSSGNNHLTAIGTVDGFSITFDFEKFSHLCGMYAWNYVYRDGAAGADSPDSGVNDYTLTFYDGPNGTGSVIGSAFSNSLGPAVWGGANIAQRVDFGTTYYNVRSVVMTVNSNHGSTDCTGLNEIAFNGTGGVSRIESFAAASFAQYPDPAVLNWSVRGAVSSLVIEPDIGDVTGLSTNGTGSVEVYPNLGVQTYTLTLNGEVKKTASVVGLPEKGKLHIYLLMGQSNMQGDGRWYNASLDGPHPRALKFGSRNGMEKMFAEGTHPLTILETGVGARIGMGVAFGKTMLASQSDPNVVICLINHAHGDTSIQEWAPGATAYRLTNPVTGEYHKLYDDAVQRVHDAEPYGVLKGVLWHQGEYNAGNRTNPNSEPELYAGRLHELVDSLRAEFNNPSLPFICGKLVPDAYYSGFTDRVTVENALADLPNQRNNTFCVDNNGLSSLSIDAIHFNAASQRLLGQRYAAAMINFYSDPFLLYMGGYLTPAQMADPLLTDPLGDNDGDGRVNYLEYALRFNPMVADYSSPMTISTVAQPPTVSFNRRTDTEAPAYGVDFSTNLVDWVTNAVVEVAGSPLDHGDGSATVTFQPLTNTPAAFFRLKVGSE